MRGIPISGHGPQHEATLAVGRRHHRRGGGRGDRVVVRGRPGQEDGVPQLHGDRGRLRGHGGRMHVREGRLRVRGMEHRLGRFRGGVHARRQPLRRVGGLGPLRPVGSHGVFGDVLRRCKGVRVVVPHRLRRRLLRPARQGRQARQRSASGTGGRPPVRAGGRHVRGRGLRQDGLGGRRDLRRRDGPDPIFGPGHRACVLVVHARRRGRLHNRRVSFSTCAPRRP